MSEKKPLTDAEAYDLLIKSGEVLDGDECKSDDANHAIEGSRRALGLIRTSLLIMMKKPDAKDR